MVEYHCEFVGEGRRAHSDGPITGLPLHRKVKRLFFSDESGYLAREVRPARNRQAGCARHQAKWLIVRDMYRHGWYRQKILDLFAIIDWMMRLPKEQDEIFCQSLQHLEEEANMPYVTSIERLGLEKGIEQGMQQGMQKGQARLLERQLTRRFGDLPSWACSKLTSATESELQAWADAVLLADTLVAVFDAGPDGGGRPTETGKPPEHLL